MQNVSGTFPERWPCASCDGTAKPELTDSCNVFSPALPVFVARDVLSHEWALSKRRASSSETLAVIIKSAVADVAAVCCYS